MHSRNNIENLSLEQIFKERKIDKKYLHISEMELFNTSFLSDFTIQNYYRSKDKILKLRDSLIDLLIHIVKKEFLIKSETVFFWNKLITRIHLDRSMKNIYNMRDRITQLLANNIL